MFFGINLSKKKALVAKGCTGADFLQAIHNLAERYGITDEMTKNFLVYNFQKEKTQNGKNVERLQAREAKELIRREKQLGARSNKFYLIYLFMILSLIYITDENGVYYIHSVSGEYSYGILRKKYGYGIRRGSYRSFPP